MSDPPPEDGKLEAQVAGTSEAPSELSEEHTNMASAVDDDQAVHSEAEDNNADDGGDDGDDNDDDDDDDDEPRLKYTRLTKSLGSVYRNGDAVSCNLVFGDRMVRQLLTCGPCSPRN